MGKKFMIAAQLSTVHSTAAQLSPANIATHLARVTDIVPLDSLAVGWTERADLFRMLTDVRRRPAKEVLLWYPLLSDYPGFSPSHLVVNSRSEPSAGWSGYEGTGIAETFRQACPNNPDATATSLGHLQRIMAAYPFDGVFLDKIRFPSPANGLAEVFSCFCPHCRRRAAEAGLDLDAVKAALDTRGTVKADGALVSIPEGAEWLDRLVSDQSVLRRFLAFRAESVTRLVAAATRTMKAMGRKVALDVFTPMLAPLVGQDLPVLAAGADWVKPMIYRFGRGPANLRSELPTLLRDLAHYLGCGEQSAWQWAEKHVAGLGATTLDEIGRVAPLDLVCAEAKRAVSLVGQTPLHLGVESVSIPGTMEIGPQDIAPVLEIGAEAGAAGFVLSWDLLHTPLENLQPLRAYAGLS